MKDIAIIGEVMMELASAGGKKYLLGAAGDTYNTACTLQGLGGDVVYLTSLGTGQAADSIREHAAEHHLSLLEPKGESVHSPGLYMISNDAAGERNFDYWRNESSAKALFSDAASLSLLLQEITQIPYCYVSGITVALMSFECRLTLLDFLLHYRKRGGKFIFDPNYRPALWPDERVAMHEIAAFKKHVDLYLPGFEEEQQLAGANSATEAAIALLDAGVGEVVIKNGPESCTLVCDRAISRVSIKPSKAVVDTTGAGDTFNGAYIGARLVGLEPEAAVSFAAQAAAKVITVRGGVLPAGQISKLKRVLFREAKI
jgi:2-dehydro-3-deoxygluconokinase